MSEAFPTEDNMQRAQREAIERVRCELKGVDVGELCRRTALSLAPERGIEIALFGRKLFFSPRTLCLSAADQASVHATEELLVLRYLALKSAVRLSGELIGFRHLPGGNFYLEPILKRTSQMLLRRLGNDANALRKALAHYPHQLKNMGDVGAAVLAIGPLELTLIYRLGDEEFEPTLDILFDRAIAGVYHTDEIAALAHWLCRGLMQR